NGAVVAIDDQLGDGEAQAAARTVFGSAIARVFFKHPPQAIRRNSRAVILNIDSESIDQLPFLRPALLRGIRASAPRLPPLPEIGAALDTDSPIAGCEFASVVEQTKQNLLDMRRLEREAFGRGLEFRLNTDPLLSDDRRHFVERLFQAFPDIGAFVIGAIF